jgi:hypothetical protein
MPRGIYPRKAVGRSQKKKVTRRKKKATKGTLKKPGPKPQSLAVPVEPMLALVHGKRLHIGCVAIELRDISIDL